MISASEGCHPTQRFGPDRQPGSLEGSLLPIVLAVAYPDASFSLFGTNIPANGLLPAFTFVFQSLARIIG
jgi:hypothetical protein